MPPKRQFSVRLRPDQEQALAAIEAADPEQDPSKIIRRAIDEYLSARRLHISEEAPLPYASFKRQEAAPADARAALDKLTAAAKKSERARKQQAARKQRKPPRAA